jgi:hypothetical protein
MRDLGERHTAAWCSQDAGRAAAFFSADGSRSINGDALVVGRNANGLEI